MDIQYHIRGAELHGRIRMGGKVIQELLSGFDGLFGGFGLFGRNGGERHQDCHVDGSGIVKYATYDFLHSGDAVGASAGRGVGGHGVLRIFTIYSRGGGIRGMLGPFGLLVAIFEQLLFYISRHGEAEYASKIVPL
jgi:hypothetical protein